MNDDLEQNTPAEALEGPAEAATPVRRRRVQKTDDAAPEAVSEPLTAYRVVKASISPNGGGRASIIRPGEVAHLTKAQAKHYNALGFLAPIIED